MQHFFQLLPGRRAKIDVQVINPKAMTINHLYGYIDPNSLEWIEGIIPMTTKKMIYIANINQKIQNEQFINDTIEMDSSNLVENTQNSTSILKGSEIRVRRRSSLLSTNAVRRLSVIYFVTCIYFLSMQYTINKMKLSFLFVHLFSSIFTIDPKIKIFYKFHIIHFVMLFMCLGRSKIVFRIRRPYPRSC